MNFRIKRLLEKITIKCFDISNTTVATMFASYSGHVNCVTVYGYRGGYKKDIDADIHHMIWLNDKDGLENLKKIYNYLLVLEKELKGGI